MTKADAGDASFAYIYQWIRVDSDGTSNAANISGATSSTYTLAAADQGKRVKVKVGFKDDAGNFEERTSDAYPTSGTIGAAADTTGPAVSTVAVSSTAPSGQGGFYKAGDDIAVTVTFNEAIVVTGTPALEITVGTAAKSASCAAHATENTRLVCTYRVASGDADGDGIAIAANKLTLPSSATIKDAANNDATRTYSAVAAQSAHKVDAVAPAAPRGFAAAAEVGQVRLTWNAPSPADASIAKWQVRRKTTGSYGNWADVSGGASARRHVDTSVMSGTAYTYQLRAVDTATNAGASATSASVRPAAAVSTAPVAQTVPADWALIPKDAMNNPRFTAGQRFRLLFVTSTRTPATSTAISTYNGFVQNAASRNATLRPFRSQFRALISTSTVDARDNTATTGTGVPIYWVAGDRVADNYADFYDGSWDSRARKTETGGSNSPGHLGGIWTGSNEDGTKHTNHAGHSRQGACESVRGPVRILPSPWATFHPK